MGGLHYVTIFVRLVELTHFRGIAQASEVVGQGEVLSILMSKVDYRLIYGQIDVIKIVLK